tara:strand:- start:1150 stop:1608 length:459 start_codon:yes stop_codon:yes gene_type:complete
MIKELAVLANHLDAKGLRKEADYLDRIIKSEASSLGLFAICWLTGCKGVSKDDLNRAGVEYEFEYSDPNNPNPEEIINVYDPTGKAERTEEDGSINLKWHCNNYELLMDILHLKEGYEGMIKLSLTWDIGDDGFLDYSGNPVEADVSDCIME